MKTIIVHPFASADAGMFDGTASADSAAPWLYLKYFMAQQGIALETSYRTKASPADAEWIVFMNAPSSCNTVFSWRACLKKMLGQGSSDDYFQRCMSAGLKQRMALMLWEPEVVYPLNYQHKVHENFARVFTWMTVLQRQGKVYREIVWPQPPVDSVPDGENFDQRKLMCNFSGNKTSDQFNELYSARLEVIRYMETHHLARFDHYGPGWSADFPSWKGMVESKTAVYPGYRFGLCYENMSNVDGYITEKIFDCLRAGCVPVYWGAPDIADRVDPASFVDRRRFDSTPQLISYLEAMPQAQWEQMRNAGLAYLESSGFARYLPQSFAAMFSEGLENASYGAR